MKMVTAIVRTTSLQHVVQHLEKIGIKGLTISEVKGVDMNREERLRQARESIEEAMLLSREHMGNKAVLTKLYHAMMECLFALFDIKDIGKLTHADIIKRFEEEYVKTGKIDGEILDVLRRAYDLTHECDCEHMPVPTDQEIAAARRAAEDFLRKAAGLSKREVTEHENSAV